MAESGYEETDQETRRREEEEAARLRKHTEDQQDLGNEQAVREVGRIRRFVADEVREGGSGRSKKNADEVLVQGYLSELERRLADPKYAALYREVFGKIDDAYDAVTDARRELLEQHDQISTELAEVQERAATLADGTRAYVLDDGTWITEQGRKLSAAETAALNIPENAAHWDEAKPHLDQLRVIEDQL